MTNPEDKALLEMSAELTAAKASPWEPRCIAHAFARQDAQPIDFTMQAWIELEAMRSPLLQGELPEDLEDLEDALNAVGQSAKDLDSAQAIDVGHAVIVVISEAFAMALPMKEPGAETQETEGPDGFGTWLPIFACLVTQCGLSPADARALRVAEAYALIAAHRRNQGWNEAGQPYNGRASILDAGEEAANG
jgi:hypothetical protein